MKNFYAISILAVLAASPSLAADLRGGLKDDVATSDYSKPAFVGLGVGIEAGGQFNSLDIQDKKFHFDGISSDGLVAGLHVEYLFASGRFRFGPELSGGFSNVNTVANLGTGDIDLINMESYYGGCAKAGIVFGKSTLVSACFGYELQQWGSDIKGLSADVGVWKIGGRVETMLFDNVSGGLIFDYLTPESVDVNGKDVTKYLEDSEGVRIMGRVTYRQ